MMSDGVLPASVRLKVLFSWNELLEHPDYGGLRGWRVLGVLDGHSAGVPQHNKSWFQLG